MKIVAIILARGGSKGLPGKNIMDFCGKPMLAWSIEQASKVREIDSVWVSSDSEKILSVSKQYGAEVLHRPSELSGDEASAESGWLHSIETIENTTGAIDLVIALQATSPLREPKDIERGIKDFQNQQCDSMFSCSPLNEDFFIWEEQKDSTLTSITYDYNIRQRRQNLAKKFVENGSFYIFKPEILRKNNNRLGGKIGMTQMEYWKIIEVDSKEYLEMGQVLMHAYLL